MSKQLPLGQPEAEKAMALSMSPRAHLIARLERYVKGDQYIGRANWFDASVPLMQRAPCIVYPVAKNAIRSTVSLCMGEGRFPRVTSMPGEDGRIVDAEFGLSPEESAILDAFINGSLARHTGLTAASRRMLRTAQGEKSACVVVCARNGRICLDAVKARNAMPTFVEGGREYEVESLEIRYPYLDKYWNEAERKEAVRALVYRRVIDAQRDVTYHPIVAPEDGSPIPNGAWREHQAFEHGLGFCPVIWYPHACDGREEGEVDGHAVHEELLDEIVALNFSLSQRHRAALYCGDPQYVETGVSDDDGMVDGSAAVILVDQASTADGRSSLYMQQKASGGNEGARRKGPGTTWRYQNEAAKVSLLSLPGDALKSIDEHARDVKSKLDESLSVVHIDPANSSLRIGELSGSAIRKLYMRMTAACDEVREDFGDHALLPLIDMLLRMVAILSDSLRISGLPKVAPILGKFIDTVSGEWMSPELSLAWGDYFDDSAVDEKDHVEVAARAHEAGLITRVQAVQKVAPIFGIKDAAAVAKEIEEEIDSHGSLEHALGALTGHKEPDGDEAQPEEEDDGPESEPSPPSSRRAGAT